MDHSNHVRLTETEFSDDALVGATVYGAGDEKIGKVSHYHKTGIGGHVIVDVGGFLGLGMKPVSLDMSQMDFMRDEKGQVHATTAWTKDHIEALPEHKH